MKRKARVKNISKKGFAFDRCEVTNKHCYDSIPEVNDQILKLHLKSRNLYWNLRKYKCRFCGSWLITKKIRIKEYV